MELMIYISPLRSEVHLTGNRPPHPASLFQPCLVNRMLCNNGCLRLCASCISKGVKEIQIQHELINQQQDLNLKFTPFSEGEQQWCLIA